MRFENPEYLYLLFLIPLLIGFYFYFLSKKKKDLAQLADSELQKELMPNYSIVRAHCKFALILLALLLCFITLAKPQIGGKTATKRQGVELVVALDVSNSMLVKDVLPSRLENAKHLISKLTEDKNVGKIGLIVFAGDAYVQLPVTTDFSAVKMLLPGLSPALISAQGTAIGTAIDKSVQLLSKQKDNKSAKLILLITDGENHEDDAVESAKKANKEDCMVSVLGIGRSSGTPIPDMETGGYKKDKSGETILSKLNEEMCKNIAKAGGGSYIHADNTSTAQKQIQQQIDDIVSGNGETTVYSEYTDIFAWITALALILLIVEFFIFERKRLKK
jgi:Ca-activated chloride channel family protein